MLDGDEVGNLPLAPTNATTAVFALLASWNDLMMPSLLTADPTPQSLPVIQTLRRGMSDVTRGAT